ncbi:MAG: YiiX/YebB-like N1pC/P60 family cysteine hydrolase [Pseudohongiellaceae bacterium]
MFSAITRALGERLAAYLSKTLPGYRKLDTVPIEQVMEVLRRGDILLIEGNSRVSVAIKYLTQSSWSHSALHIGNQGDSVADPVLLEADLREGVRLVNLEHYRDFNIRICRPVNVNADEIDTVIDFARSKLGHRYDMKNVLDLMRYLIQRPAVPNRLRRSLIGLGSGEPTRAICSTLIAEAFQKIRYPILPLHNGETGENGEVPEFYRRHFTHYTPRDFDLSPYFRIVKPTLEAGFDFRSMNWVAVDKLQDLKQGQSSGQRRQQQSDNPHK